MTERVEQESKRVYIETYGCQMNVADSEIIAAQMQLAGYQLTDQIDEADAVLINTCSVRDNAEQRIIHRLDNLNGQRRRSGHPQIVGVLGCMAERVQETLIQDHGVDLVAGPDAYTDLPHLIATAEAGEPAISIELSKSETYSDVIPVRLPGLHISGFVSIMRGCDNFCTYCIVPYTRGRERSRDPESIVREVQRMAQEGYREVTLLGQNVNSYLWQSETGVSYTFADLLRKVAEAVPTMRIRFTSPHPKDMKDETLEVMSLYPNICRHIHFPLQSGSNRILERMHRRYTREWYLERVERIRDYTPDCGLSTDVFCGFSGETEEDFQETLEVMRLARLDSAFMFKYSERPGTYASRHLVDDVPEEVKVERLNRMIALQNELSLESNERDVGKSFEVLIEGYSKRSRDDFFGRTQQNKVIVFPKGDNQIGKLVTVRVERVTSATMIGSEVEA
ncbi:tRNA (N6-isopentenyl adenosine(37)-C2)-methylthiotransferase MiaB [uncultured Porphyromonas sp.]|uniref:tRNA (N6-isopentenyl adenosine(37)-C2)-methylthiotransferase MiaB n=1 Tax=uncultured Porphyromonas sp. TaxID=159274 RepID=UPI0026309817|nr:tRNA (N6-isopentenyl adenosine(37)-C2)-methylthiotransferase MiaB [uncultured Porphyromonas sp.]